MELFPFLVGTLLLAVPFVLLGWWLSRQSKSGYRLATLMNEHEVDVGQLRVAGKTHAWLLFADVRFVVFIVLRRYRRLDLPPDVANALDDARADYLLECAVFTVLVLLAFGYSLYRNL